MFNKHKARSITHISYIVKSWRQSNAPILPITTMALWKWGGWAHWTVFMASLYMYYVSLFGLVEHHKHRFLFDLSIYIYIYMYIYIYIYYIYIYIHTNLLVNAIVRLPYPRSGDSKGQETILAPSADKQTRNYDIESSNHHPSLSTLRSKGLSCSKMKWWAIYTNLPVNTTVRLPHLQSGDS